MNIAKPGAVLRSLRRDRGWTLKDVSSRTGLPVSTLSKIENDKLSPTYEKLVRFSRAFEVDIAVLFAANTIPAAATPGPVAAGRRSVMRGGDGSKIDTRFYDHVYQHADLLNKAFVPLIAEIRARSVEEFGGELIRHSGEEYAYVLEGAVELHTDLYSPIRLEVGDSIYFDSSMGHVYLAAAPGRCRVLSICSGEGTHSLAPAREVRRQRI